jgi:hypothetical protein
MYNVVYKDCKAALFDDHSESAKNYIYKCSTKRKRAKGQAKIYKTLHRKLKIEQHEPHKKPRVIYLTIISYRGIKIIYEL